MKFFVIAAVSVALLFVAPPLVAIVFAIVCTALALPTRREKHKALEAQQQSLAEKIASEMRKTEH